jgi:hypothetical protein
MPKQYRPSESERFWAKVDKTDTCWLWTAAKSPAGYGYFRVGGRAGQYVIAHRYAYTATTGQIPEGLVLDHLCRVRQCVNPAHLEPVTQAENNRRARLTHCRRGHPYEGANVLLKSDGRRECKSCIADAARLRYLRKSAVHGQTL